MLFLASALPLSLSSSLQSLIDSLGIIGRVGWTVGWGGVRGVFPLGAKMSELCPLGPFGSLRTVIVSCAFLTPIGIAWVA